LTAGKHQLEAQKKSFPTEQQVDVLPCFASVPLCGCFDGYTHVSFLTIGAGAMQDFSSLGGRK
jgi:hypothetical protein